MNIKIISAVTITVIVTVSSVAYASLRVPHRFSPATVIDAGLMNENFDSIERMIRHEIDRRMRETEIKSRQYEGRIQSLEREVRSMR